MAERPYLARALLKLAEVGGRIELFTDEDAGQQGFRVTVGEASSFPMWPLHLSESTRLAAIENELSLWIDAMLEEDEEDNG